MLSSQKYLHMRLNKLLQSIFTVAAIVALFSSCFHEDNRINATCFDEVLNQEELFIDCGGPNCAECPPSCDNGVLDWVEGWQEVGVDCGGPCETCCENGRWDDNSYDPALSEEWIDCGGPECPPCELCANGFGDITEQFINPVSGLTEQAIDCDSDPLTECPPCNELCNDGLLNGLETFCADCGGVCAPCDDSHCMNEIMDVFDPEATTTIQSETGIDCGGCMCLDCNDPLFCFDEYISGFEGDAEFPGIDCGGPICVPCNTPSLCTDGYLSGYETEIDCYDGDDALISVFCPPCSSTCNNGVCDGFETDVDCGGEFCPPCATEPDPDTGLGGNFMTYTVTTSDETEVFYESNNAFLTGMLIEGFEDQSIPIVIEDQLTFGGGSCHSVVFNLEDNDGDTLSWTNEEEFFLNFVAITVNSADNIILDANLNDYVYESRNSPTGITLNEFSYDSVLLPGSTNSTYVITVEGTFSGELKVTDGTPGTGETATVTNGAFRISWAQIILP